MVSQCYLGSLEKNIFFVYFHLKWQVLWMTIKNMILKVEVGKDS